MVLGSAATTSISALGTLQLLEVWHGAWYHAPYILVVSPSASLLWSGVDTDKGPYRGRSCGQACLLHSTDMLLSLYNCSLTKHLLNAAKSCIPVLWKQILPLLYICDCLKSRTYMIWSTWEPLCETLSLSLSTAWDTLIHFRYSNHFSTFLSA